MKIFAAIIPLLAAFAASAVTTTLEYEDSREAASRAAVSNEIASVESNAVKRSDADWTLATNKLSRFTASTGVSPWYFQGEVWKASWATEADSLYRYGSAIFRPDAESRWRVGNAGDYELLAYLSEIESATNDVFTAFRAATNALANAALSRKGWSMTTPGVITDWLASGATGGPRIRGSSQNLNDYTAYAYNGIVYRRGGTSEDYLFDEASQNGIVRRKELAGIATEESDPVWTAQKSGYATVGTVAAVSNKVEALETWAIGEETQMRVENAGETNAVMSVLYTNKVMYSSAQEHTNTYNRAKGYTDAAIGDALDIVDATKADKAWGNHSSSGGPTPEDTLTVEKQKITLTGGGNFSWLESSTGGYWVMSVSLGSTWTLESLADAQNPTNVATITLHDMDGNAVQTVASTSSREAYAVAGEQYIKVRQEGGNDIITITYPIVADSAPTMLFKPDVAGSVEEYRTADQWPAYISSVVPSGNSGMWTNTVTMVGAPGKGFFRAKYMKAGYTYTKFNQPLGLSQVTIGVKTYNVSVENINGKNLMVLTEAN